MSNRGLLNIVSGLFGQCNSLKCRHFLTKLQQCRFSNAVNSSLGNAKDLTIPSAVSVLQKELGQISNALSQCHRSYLSTVSKSRRHLSFCRSCSTLREDGRSTTPSDEQSRKDQDVASPPMTHFGFTTVREDAKVEKVREVFTRVAEKYDLMNDVMSAGVHRLWKDEFIHQLAPKPRMKLIDVAGGTGDIAFRYMNYTTNKMGRHDGRQVTICDINEDMLRVGEQRAVQQGLTHGVSWLHGNAECLPVDDNSYDAYTIAFGIRNCTHVQKVLDEAYRVLKPGGRFMCLEFSQVRNSLLRVIYDQYSFEVIPVMGHVIAQDWNSYQYLVESIRKFPNQGTFASWIGKAGFSSVTVKDMTGGVVAIHSGFKF